MYFLKQNKWKYYYEFYLLSFNPSKHYLNCIQFQSNNLKASLTNLSIFACVQTVAVVTYVCLIRACDVFIFLS